MDIQQYYIEKGQGEETIILLHGNGEDCTYFVGQIDEFARRYHVYAIDTRGHGRTMDLHHIAKAHILGFSDGGNIAMIFALRHPERVDRLILNGANLNARGVKFLTQFPIEVGYRIARLFARWSAKARANAEMLGLMVNDPNVAPSELAAIRARTLVIAGTHDMIKDAHTRLIAQSIPGAELVLIDGSHFIAYEKPEEFNRAVLVFL